MLRPLAVAVPEVVVLPKIAAPMVALPKFTWLALKEVAVPKLAVRPTVLMVPLLLMVDEER